MKSAAGTDASMLRECIRALVRRFSLAERADVECCGVTVAQAATLEALHRLGAMRLSDLSRQLGISPSTLTRNVARLEERELIARSGDPGDRRSSRVALTDAGAAAALEVERQEEAFAASILQHLPEDRAARVLSAVRDLLAAIRDATEGCCPGAFDHLMADEPWPHRQCSPRSSSTNGESDECKWKPNR